MAEILLFNMETVYCLHVSGLLCLLFCLATNQNVFLLELIKWFEIIFVRLILTMIYIFHQILFHMTWAMYPCFPVYKLSKRLWNWVWKRSFCLSTCNAPRSQQNLLVANHLEIPPAFWIWLISVELSHLAIVISFTKNKQVIFA